MPHTAPCTLAKLKATQSPPSSIFSLRLPALVSSPHGPRNIENLLSGPFKIPRRPPGMLAVLVFMFAWNLISR